LQLPVAATGSVSAALVFPLSGRAHPLAAPGRGDGQVSAALKARPPGEEAMTYPTFIEIDGKRVLWREIVQRRREQPMAAAKAAQAALLELKDG